jgi:hypothetical protein
MFSVSAIGKIAGRRCLRESVFSVNFDSQQPDEEQTQQAILDKSTDKKNRKLQALLEYNSLVIQEQ